MFLVLVSSIFSNYCRPASNGLEEVIEKFSLTAFSYVEVAGFKFLFLLADWPLFDLLDNFEADVGSKNGLFFTGLPWKCVSMLPWISFVSFFPLFRVNKSLNSLY